MHVTFIAPAPWNAISGGYLYDRAVVAALIALGHAVDVVELGGRHPLPDEAAHRAASSAWAALPATTVPVIDGLCLPAFAPFAEGLGARGAVGLIHHPTALETGRDAAARDALLSIERATFPSLPRIVVTSADTAQRLVADFAVLASRIAVVEPGTPSAPRSFGPAREGCVILSVATLLPRKGHDVLLRALARLTDLDWRLVLAGGAPDAAYHRLLRDLMTELDLAERVAFAGEIAPAELAPLWEEAGMFALATWYEGYGMAIAEALRRGLPVAVTSGGAAAALVTSDCSVVCPPGDHAGLSRAMRRVIYDRPLRQSMADAAFRIGATLPDWTVQGAAFAHALAAR